MPRAKREQASPEQLRNHAGSSFTDADMEMISRVMRRYGLKRAAAIRLLVLAGAPHHDPSPPKE